ncbi:MAG: hypothetical protein WC718_18025 [Phycisphaerales bacterium]|jgi:hypothetical protein
MTYQFTMWVDAGDRVLDEWADAIYEAGGDDTSPGVSNGKDHVDFHREATSLEEAIRSAHVTLAAAGLRVIRCEIDAEQSAAMGIAP